MLLAACWELTCVWAETPKAHALLDLQSKCQALAQTQGLRLALTFGELTLSVLFLKAIDSGRSKSSSCLLPRQWPEPEFSGPQFSDESQADPVPLRGLTGHGPEEVGPRAHVQAQTRTGHLDVPERMGRG